jgi:hypothetical protein
MQLAREDKRETLGKSAQTTTRWCLTHHNDEHLANTAPLGRAMKSCLEGHLMYLLLRHGDRRALES